MTLKWPNDLVVGERKLAGLLAESAPLPGAPGSPGARRVVVAGIGLNVRWPPGPHQSGDETSPVPEELRATATSISRETGVDLDPAVLLRLILVDLDHRLDDLVTPAGRTQLAELYRRRCSTIGQEVRVVLADGELRGTAADITPEGHLVVESGGELTTVTAGDVVHVRPEP